MRDKENIRQIAALNPDYMGFILYEKSPRYIGSHFILPSDFPQGIKKVGVFVNASTAKIEAAADELSLDYVQLHGDESVEQVRELKKKGFRIFKVFSIGDSFDFRIVEPYEDFVDFFLFDTKGKYYGGNAARFDWKLLEKYNQRIPFFLSGGLSPENINEIREVNGMNVHAMDVNSGVEDSPGIKNVEKVKSIVGFLKV
jgi:phosphoribosylanthranilate isomerase